MTISITALTWLVSIALLATVLAPVVLLIFWIKDLKEGTLW